MVLNRRGIFFIIIITVILSLFLLSYTFYSGVQERKTTQKRIETMNNFLISIEQDLERQLFISGFRIIFIFEKRTIEKGFYITNLSDTFEELFFNGTIYGAVDSDTTILMTGAKFSDIQSLIQSKADKINVNTTLESPTISILQTDPWNLKVTLTSKFTMSDKSNLATWNKTQTIVSFIPISNFKDPLYTIETNALVIKTIKKNTLLKLF